MHLTEKEVAVLTALKERVQGMHKPEEGQIDRLSRVQWLGVQMIMGAAVLL